MTLENPAYVISADSHSAALFRQAAGSGIQGTGVMYSTDLAVTQNGTPNMSVNVAAGQIWMPGTLGATTGFPTNVTNQSAYGLPTSQTSQGPYYGYQDGTVNLTISASSPSNPRIDIVCASIQDAQYSGSNNQPVLQVITGTPAASPVAPAAPASSVVIAQIAVGTSVTTIVTANITDERPFAIAGPQRSQYRAEMYRAAALGTITTTDTLVPFDTIAYDPNGNCVTGAAAAYTCPVAGVYLMACCFGIAAPNTLTLIRFYKNGAFIRQPFDIIGNTQTGNEANASGTLLCNAGDTLQFYIRAIAASSSMAIGQTSAYGSFTLLYETA